MSAETKTGFHLCSTPCEACPVHDLPADKREAVELVFEKHYQELETARDTEGIHPGWARRWAAEALQAPRFSLEKPAEAELVAAAVIKINRDNCRTYKPE